MKGVLLGVLIMGALVAEGSAVEIIAHRGASSDAPENTLAAIGLAWKQGADAAEIDVHLTQDGKIVVIHDDTTKRTAGADLEVDQHSLAELRSLDAGRWKGKEWRGEKIPTIEEALAAVPEGKRLFVEIKCGPEILDELERTLLQRKREQRRLVLIGFSIDTLQEAKRRFPGVPVYWLVDFSKDHRIGKVPDVESLIRETAAAGLDGLNVKSKGFVDAEFVRKIKAAGLRLFVWTVDAPSTAKRLAAAGVDGITTNRPAKLIAELKGEK